MEVVIPTQGLDFDFNNSLSAVTSPYSTAPSSPKRFGEYYFSAPTSPSRLSSFYRDLDELCTANGDVYGSQSPPKVPFNWEENPGTPKSRRVQDDDDDGRDQDDFAFDFSVDLERTSLSADELFDGGKIRPLKPPPRLQLFEISNIQGSSSTIRKSSSPDSRSSKKTVNERGRERNTPTMISSSTNYGALSSSKSGRRATRSLSPLRVSQYPWELDEDQVRQPNNNNNSKQDLALVSKASISSTTTTTPSSNPSKSSSRKWRLRDFLLFRSASEGRASEKDPLRKYYMKRHEDVKNASFRSTDSFGGSARRKGPVSAHELHYTVNKAVSEDLKKKTFLPYKQGILGRLAFNPAVHALANGFGSLTRA